ncbi:MAG: hypothetical protein P8100_10955 [bacterium]
MKITKTALFVLTIAFLFSLNVNAQPEEGWTKIGEKLVSFKADKDKIMITGKERNVTKIKVTCIQGAVKIKNIYVKMSDGQEKNFNPSIGVMNKNMSTIGFKLPGDNNELEELELEYDSMGTILTNKRAKVEIWGKLKE